MKNTDYIEKWLKEKLSDKRYNHSKGCAKTAQKLAKIFNQDEEKAYLAGLVHDCAKNFEDSKKLLSIIYKEFPDCSEYHFNVCAENQFFKPYGNCEFYGMIKPLNSNAEQVMVALKKANEFPYLGIPLD